jgi:hypothetical protein
MKPTIVSIIAFGSAALLSSAPPAQAGYVVTLTEQAVGVVATGSGAIDLTGLVFDATLNRVSISIK